MKKFRATVGKYNVDEAWAVIWLDEWNERIVDTSLHYDDWERLVDALIEVIEPRLSARAVERVTDRIAYSRKDLLID